ncbi:MAG: hypothetical protein AAFY65_14165 [Pseudomonadota bacterium]
MTPCTAAAPTHLRGIMANNGLLSVAAAPLADMAFTEEEVGQAACRNAPLPADRRPPAETALRYDIERDAFPDGSEGGPLGHGSAAHVAGTARRGKRTPDPFIARWRTP